MKRILKCKNCGGTDFFHRTTTLKKLLNKIITTYECRRCKEYIFVTQSHKSAKKQEQEKK